MPHRCRYPRPRTLTDEETDRLGELLACLEACVCQIFGQPRCRACIAEDHELTVLLDLEHRWA